MPARIVRSARHVLLDWNGTLVDDVDLCIDVVNGLLDEAALPRIEIERYRRIFDFPVRDYYARLGFELEGGGWERWAKKFIAGYARRAHECRLREGTVELLSDLRERGVPATILTAAQKRSVEEALDARGIRDLVGHVVGLDDHYAQGKEHLGRRWVEESEIDPADVVLLGDTTHDHEVAKAMGVTCVLVAGGHHHEDRLGKTGRPVVGSLAALIEGK